LLWIASVVGFVDLTNKVSQEYQVITACSLEDDTSHQQSQIRSPLASVINSLQCDGPPITDERDALYMSNYVENIGPWFDLFDSTDKHFSTVVPQLALNNRLLLYSCLAASAGQYSLLNEAGGEEALEYYNIALRTLHDHLNNRGHEPATFASCLLIAHCEMIESHASDWNVHLQGTRQLVTTQGWNAASGGLAQAVSVSIAPWIPSLTDLVSTVFLDILSNDDLGFDLFTHDHASSFGAMASNTDIPESTTMGFRLMVEQDCVLAGLCTQSSLFDES
jgi:hypothetical protein